MAQRSLVRSGALDFILVKGARQHNLKNIDVEIPRNALCVITGLSGSGKSSLAFDTIYAEGQRRYVESLSAYARQFLEQMGKPDVDAIEGLSPAISIEQKTTSKNPRSTVGTVTEVYDYLRLLFARVGKPHCPQCGATIQGQSVQQMVDQILTLQEGTKFALLAPLIRGRKGEYKKELESLCKRGFTRAIIDGETYDLSENIPALDKQKKHTIDLYIDRLVMKPGLSQRVADSVETAIGLTEGLLKLSVIGAQEQLFSEKFACIDCGISLPEIEPRLFSFNNPHGACPGCNGLGENAFFDVALVVPDESLSLKEGAVRPWHSDTMNYYPQMLECLARHYQQSIETPYAKLPEHFRQVVLHGSGKEAIDFAIEMKNGAYRYQKPFEGVIKNLERRFQETESDSMREELDKYRLRRPCDQCHGARLKPEALSVKIGGKTIYEICCMPLAQSAEWCTSLSLLGRDQQIAQKILKEICDRLGFLVSVGLDYLSLDRTSGTLSGGESQRIRLATQIGSALMGVLYVLDEPSIGLHQRDNNRLIETLRRLRDLGNTVIVVEHDADTILAADYVIDMGPGAGHEGGHVVAMGTPQEVMAHRNSLTGQYLSGARHIALPSVRRPGNGKTLSIIGARGNNLKEVTAHIPLGTLTCVTGVSGSGKSTLILDTLYLALAQKINHAQQRPEAHERIEGMAHIDAIIDIDQSPIGRTPRSNPATYTGLFGPIRDLFAALPEAKSRGYGPGRFSFNVKGGRCEACEGDGVIRIDMQFLPDMFVTCEFCQGKRYNRETLEVRFKEKSIADVLDMTVAEARLFLENFSAIRRKLDVLCDVGLGYIHLGQQATTLSGGEAQRIKLAKELAKRPSDRTIYILDEPTTGLHFADVEKLLDVLQRLVDAGHSVVVIEHNLDVIKCADHVIDLGPEGGSGGGQILVAGTPEEVAAHPQSYTGQHLKPLLKTPASKKKR